MKKILSILLLFFAAYNSFGQKTDYALKVEIKDSLLFINNKFVHPNSTVEFFSKHFGKPDRKKKGTVNKWNEYIYDDLGISIMTLPNNVSVSFYYKSIINSQPKSQFQGQITINNHLIKHQYSFQKIEYILNPCKLNILHNTSLKCKFFSFNKNYGDNHLSEIIYKSELAE